MQWRAALWITGTFKTFPSASVKTIAGLILIYLHFRKLNGRCHLQYTSVPHNHTINSLLDPQHAKNVPPHRFFLPKLTDIQRTKLKSLALDINNCFSEVTDSFISFHPIFSPGLRLVNYFSNCITFHSPISSNNKDLQKHIQNLLSVSTLLLLYNCYIW